MSGSEGRGKADEGLMRDRKVGTSVVFGVKMRMHRDFEVSFDARQGGAEKAKREYQELSRVPT